MSYTENPILTPQRFIFFIVIASVLLGLFGRCATSFSVPVTVTKAVVN